MRTIVSCHTNCYGRFGARAAIKMLRTAGLEHVELPIFGDGEKPPLGDKPLVTTASTLGDLKGVDRLLEIHDVCVESCDITGGNPLDPKVAALAKRKLGLASHFGVKLVVGSAGKADDPARLDKLYRHLREIGDCAARLGITYCLQTAPGLCQDHRRMLQTMAALDHPHVKLNFDTGNLLYNNKHINGEVALAKTCDRVRHVHLKDLDGEYQQGDFPALGDGGSVDFVRVLELLGTCGFEGPYSIAIEEDSDEANLSVDDHHERVCRSVQYLRACGYFD